MYDTMTCQCSRHSMHDGMMMKRCGRDDCDCLAKLPYATAFVKPQCNPKMFNPAEGLCRGTMFPDLYSPYQY